MSTEDFSSDDYVFTQLKKYLNEKGIYIDSVDEEGRVHLTVNEVELKISLDNLRKEYEQSEDDETIAYFVEAIIHTNDELPEWEEAKDNILVSLFPSEFDFSDHVNYPITEEFHMVLVYDTPYGKTWINEEQLEKWGIDNKQILATAYENLDKVLESAELEVELVEDKKLCYFTLTEETMKAALILSKKLKSKVSAEIGWPVVAVIPVRDFSYLFADGDFEFFAERLGETVMNEYESSGYPVTLELLRCDDEGVKAVGRYAKSDDNNEEE